MSRPKIKIQSDITDKSLDFIGLALVLFAFYFPISALGDLPESIPSHFNTQGEADSYSGKSTIWWLPGLTAMLYFGLLLLNRFPHIFNYTKDITEENARIQYTLATKMIRWLNVTLTGGLCYISYVITDSALTAEETMGSWFLPVFVSAPTLILVIYLIQANKQK